MNDEKVNLNKILYVDDEEAWRVVFNRNLEGVYEVITANNADEGWELLKKHSNEIAIIVSDQRMPGRPGIELLKQARAYYPRIIRILTTGFSDSTIAIHATNQGAVYHYVSKPWNGEELLSVLKRAMDFHLIRKERDNLLERKLSSIQRKHLESKLQSLLVFGESKSNEIHYTSNALLCYLESIFIDPGRLFSLKSIYKNSQNELSVVGGNFRLIHQIIEITEKLSNIDRNTTIDPRKMLLLLRDKHPQVIFTVQHLDLNELGEVNEAEKVISYYLDLLVSEWMNESQNKKLLEIAELPDESSEGNYSYTLKIGFFNDPIPFEGAEDDPLFNGINLSDTLDEAWLKFVFVVYHFGGFINPQVLSTHRISFTLSDFDRSKELTEIPCESVIAELFKKFEAWNYAEGQDYDDTRRSIDA